MATIIIAMTEVDGRPSVNMGMNEVWPPHC
jgi:hypothetical protein